MKTHHVQELQYNDLNQLWVRLERPTLINSFAKILLRKKKSSYHSYLIENFITLSGWKQFLYALTGYLQSAQDKNLIFCGQTIRARNIVLKNELKT